MKKSLQIHFWGHVKNQTGSVEKLVLTFARHQTRYLPSIACKGERNGSGEVEGLAVRSFAESALKNRLLNKLLGLHACTFDSLVPIVEKERPDVLHPPTVPALRVGLLPLALEIHGRAAVVVPDNVLFEGGAGETVRRKLMHECELHTVLRLPTGIFYAQGVKANVLFFDRKPASSTPWTKAVWFYDLRTNVHFTLKQNPMTRSDLDEFVQCYRPGERHKRRPTWSEKNPGGRWRCYSYEEIVSRDKASLDIFWLRDESLDEASDLPDPHVIAAEIVDDLESALAQIRDVLSDLEERAAVLRDRDS